MQWGQKVDSPFVRKPGATEPGWREDPERPGVQRYWGGSGWDKSIPPRPKPEPAWKQARVVALGILIAGAALFTFDRLSQPSDLDCTIQRGEALTGERVAVDSACR